MLKWGYRYSCFIIFIMKKRVYPSAIFYFRYLRIMNVFTLFKPHCDHFMNKHIIVYGTIYFHFVL